MANNIIPFIRFTALENVEFVGFTSIVGITNMVTIPSGDDAFESNQSTIGCQLGDGRWIIVVWKHSEDRSSAYPAYYSTLWNCPVPIAAIQIGYDFERIASSDMDSIKKQIEQWLPHLTDEELAADVSKVINGETN